LWGEQLPVAGELNQTDIMVALIIYIHEADVAVSLSRSVNSSPEAEMLRWSTWKSPV
jgi:hypothetical protein